MRPAPVNGQLFSAERDLQAILDNVPAMIGYWDRQLRCRFGNDAYLDWFGIAPVDLVGRHIRDVLGDSLYELNLPYINEVLRGVPQQFERAIPSVDGKTVRYSLANYIPDIHDGEVLGFYVLVSDITHIKRAEQSLRDSETRYREVVEDQTEVISRLRADGTFLFVNAVYCRVFGKSEEELLGKQWMPVCWPDDLEHVQEQLALLSPQHPVVTIENRVCTADGVMRWMQFVNRGFFDEHGCLQEVQSVGRDITERKEIEASLRTAHMQMERRVIERTEQLRRLAVAATLAEERERQLIAADLHDNLGQLLHVARIQVDVLEPEVPGNGALVELKALLDEASRQVRMLTSQLSPPILRSMGLSAAIRWLRDEVRRQYGLRMDFVLSSNELTPSMLQAEILFRIARELLINVVKHSGVLEATLTLGQTESEIFMVVMDQGGGVTDVERILSDPKTFGLASIRERITYLQGRMEISCPGGRGFQVEVFLPLALEQSTTGDGT